jgi:protein gp37
MPLSKIEWTEVTWNPTTGCNKVSAGCKNCYAESFSKRLKGMGIEKYKNGFKLTLHPDVLQFPKKLRKPHKIFVNSMSDIFHEKIPLSFIQKVFKVMNECPQHIFQVLTKRAERLEELSPFLNWSDNIWMGVTVENNEVKSRIENLLKTDAKIKFLSLEPLLSSLPGLNLKNIDWVIVGGESGRKSRKIEKEWVENIRLQCKKNNIAFFFKQWGGMNKKANGRELNGRTYDEMPNVA